MTKRHKHYLATLSAEDGREVLPVLYRTTPARVAVHPQFTLHPILLTDRELRRKASYIERNAYGIDVFMLSTTPVARGSSDPHIDDELPDAFDHNVLMYVLKKCQEQKSQRINIPSLAFMLKELGLYDNYSSRRRIMLSFHRWTSVGCEIYTHRDETKPFHQVLNPRSQKTFRFFSVPTLWYRPFSLDEVIEDKNDGDEVATESNLRLEILIDDRFWQANNESGQVNDFRFDHLLAIDTRDSFTRLMFMYLGSSPRAKVLRLTMTELRALFGVAPDEPDYITMRKVRRAIKTIHDITALPPTGEGQDVLDFTVSYERLKSKGEYGVVLRRRAGGRGKSPEQQQEALPAPEAKPQTVRLKLRRRAIT